MANNTTVTRQLSIFINDREVVNSFNGIGREITKVNNAMRNLNRGSETYEEDLRRLQGEATELRERQAELREEIEGTNEEMEAAGSAFSNIFTGLATGNLTLAASGFAAMKTAIISTTKAAVAFIATPIGATIAVLATIAIATKEWYNYNKEVAKANSETAAITNLSGDALNKARINASVLAKTFDQDVNEVLETARALVNEFEISYDEAFTTIKNGFNEGGYASDEYLQSLKEYPTFFNKAGFAADEFQKIVNTGIDLGIYQDKLPDAIKEFALSVTEGTPAVRDALYNAFGTEFTDKLLAGVKDGSISVKEALVSVSAEADKLGLNLQQQQQLTADLFRGAGEDAGGAIKIFEAVTTSLEQQNAVLSEADQAVKELTESELMLAQAKDNALRSEGFAIWSNNFNTWVNEVKAGFYEVIFAITNSQAELEELIKKDVNAKNTKEWAKIELDTFKDYVERRKKSLGELYDFEKVKEEFLTTVKAQQAKQQDQEQKDKLQAGIDAIENYQERIKFKNTKFNLDDIKAQTKTNNTKKKELDRAREQEKKDAAEAEKDRIEGLKALAKANLENYIANHVSIIDRDKLLTLAIIAEEKIRLDGIKAARLEALAVEKRTNEGIIEIKRQQGIDLNAADIEYLTAKTLIETENHKAIAELNKQYDTEQKELAAEELLAEKELAEAEAASKWEFDAMRAEQEYQDEVARYKKMLDSKKINDAEYNRFIEALDKKKEENDRLRRLTKTSEELSEMGKLADALVAMFGQSKAAAIATATINGGLSVIEILKTPSVFPEPLASISRAIQIAGVVALTGKTISQIQSAKAPKRAKFFFGGPTGTDAIDHDEYGPVTGVVHKNEYVVPEAMTQNPRFANVIGWLETQRQKLPKFYQGGPTSPGTTTPAASVSVEPGETGNILAAAVNKLNSILESGIDARAVFGYEQLEDMNTMNDEIKASNQNGILNT